MKRRRLLAAICFVFCLLVGNVAGVVLTTTEYPTQPVFYEHLRT